MNTPIEDVHDLDVFDQNDAAAPSASPLTVPDVPTVPAMHAVPGVPAHVPSGRAVSGRAADGRHRRTASSAVHDVPNDVPTVTPAVSEWPTDPDATADQKPISVPVTSDPLAASKAVTEPIERPQTPDGAASAPAEESSDVISDATSDDHAFIEFDHVSKTYTMGETHIQALDDVNFRIDNGEFVIVVGASGAGKSTILNILGGMDTLTSGKVFVDGNEVSTYNDKQLVLYRRYDVGFVFQFYNLVQNLTARENVELATQVSRDPLDVDEVIDAVGLDDRKDNFPSQLSGGEQQRVAIARALAKNPKLLLCDEPTGALDYNTGKQILKLLQDYARRSKMTVIIITHNYALTSIGDKVVHVKNGHIESIELNAHPMNIADVEW